MRHAVLERWSRGDSFLHRRDARAKILASLVFLIAIATTGARFEWAAICFLGMLVAGVVAADLPMAGVLRRAAVVLPFSLTFAAVNWIAGEPHRAILLLEKSFLSAWAVVLFVSTTPLPQLLRGFEMLGAPPFLLMVTQFLYRYLFMIAEQAHRMRMAALCRGGRFRAAAGAVAVLFVRSYERADTIHRAMISRGFEGHFRLLAQPHFGRTDFAFALSATALPVAAVLLART